MNIVGSMDVGHMDETVAYLNPIYCNPGSQTSQYLFHEGDFGLKNQSAKNITQELDTISAKYIFRRLGNEQTARTIDRGY